MFAWIKNLVSTSEVTLSARSSYCDGITDNMKGDECFFSPSHLCYFPEIVNCKWKYRLIAQKCSNYYFWHATPFICWKAWINFFVLCIAFSLLEMFFLLLKKAANNHTDQFLTLTQRTMYPNVYWILNVFVIFRQWTTFCFFK